MAEDNFTNKIEIDSRCCKEGTKHQPVLPANTDPATNQINNVVAEHKEGWKEHWDLLAALAISELNVMLIGIYRVYLKKVLIIGNFLFMTASVAINQRLCKLKQLRNSILPILSRR